MNRKRLFDASFSGFKRLWILFLVTLGSFSVGNALGWTSPALPRIDQTLCSNDSTRGWNNQTSCDLTGITFELAGWVGPLLPIGAILVGPWIGILIDNLGRKWAMVTLSLPTFTGWLLITLSQSSNSIVNIYVGRFLIGKYLIMSNWINSFKA